MEKKKKHAMCESADKKEKENDTLQKNTKRM